MAGKRLLVVDDEESIASLFSDYFTDLGYDVVTAKNGRNALEKFSPGRFDCVLCDLMMPEMNGIDLLRQIRALDQKIIFLMMTGHPSLDTAVGAIKEGANDFMLKPLNMEDVRLKIERALHAEDVQRSLKKVNGLLWAVIVSVPVWLILGIALGIVWKRF